MKVSFVASVLEAYAASMFRVEVIGVGIYLGYVGRVTGRGERVGTVNME